MGRGKTKALQAIIAATVAVFAAVSAFAQTPNTGAIAIFTFSTGVTLDTNPDMVAVPAGTVFELSQDVGFFFRTENSAQLLEFSGSTGLSFSRSAGGGSETSFSNPAVTFLYFRNSASAELNASANYWSDDVTSAFDIDPTDSTFIVVDTGTLAIRGASVEYSWGINAPLSFSANASFDQRDYEGTTDPSLLDETNTEVGGSVGLRVSPTTLGTLNIGFRNESITGGPFTGSSGIFGGIEIVQTVSNGSLSGSIAIDNSGAVNLTALTVGRTLEFSTASVSASLTVETERLAGSGVSLLGSAEYSRELPNGSILVDFSQSISTNSIGEDIKLSSLGFAYDKILNSSAAIGLAFDISRAEDGGAGAAPTLNRSSISATYSQAVTDDWGLSVGYIHRQNSGSAIATANSDSLFLTLSRDIQFGF